MNSVVSGRSLSREPGEKYDRAQWKAMQQAIGDSGKFAEFLLAVEWEGGLPPDVVRGEHSSRIFVDCGVGIVVADVVGDCGGRRQEIGLCDVKNHQFTP